MTIIGVAISKNKVEVSLTAERWLHIVESHNYMAGFSHETLEAIGDPDYVVAGRKGELLAIKFYEETNLGPKHLVSIYKEMNKRGFIITAFMASKIDKILRRRILWRKR